MNRARNVVGRVRRDGLVATMKGLCRALVPRSCEIFRLEKPVADATDAAHPLQSDFEALRTARAGLEGLPDEYYYDVSRNYGKCFFYIVDGKPAAILWMVRRGERDRYLKVAGNEAVIVGLYVLDEFRGRGLARDLVRQSCIQMQRKGTESIYAVIEVWNVASRRAHEANGFRKILLVRRPLLFGPRYTPSERKTESWWQVLARSLGAKRT